MAKLSIEETAPIHATDIAHIYNYYIRETTVTFEEEPVTPAEMERRVEGVRSSFLPWLVALQDDGVIGYAYATPWRPRTAYRYSAEVTIYLAPQRIGIGLGTMLYTQLFTRLEARGIHAVIAGIALPNGGSIALHEKFGMEKVAHFKEVGFKFDRWIDVGYWQRTLTS